ncbi:MAG: MBL fold metallo-hydrolase [Anaerolineales bacterium]|nr:MBL fold metallo-hydrolase [Anaerolineales bacterium]
MRVIFWGVRGSFPAPGPKTARVGGNTSCVEVRAGGHRIILDAGTGIIQLGNALVAQHQADKTPITATLLFTHTHHDHTQGFPFFKPVYFQTTTLYVFGPKTLESDLHEVLARAMLPPVFPITLDQLPCVRIVRNLGEEETVVLSADNAEPQVVEGRVPPALSAPVNVLIHALRSYAHPQGVSIYRIEHNGKAVVYSTDTEGYVGGDQRLIRFARDAALLIHDAQYTEPEYSNPQSSKQGWGHSTWRMALNVAQRAQVKQLVLFHHDPEHSDEMLDAVEKEARALFPATRLAREGMTVEVE